MIEITDKSEGTTTSYRDCRFSNGYAYGDIYSNKIFWTPGSPSRKELDSMAKYIMEYVGKFR